MSASPCICDCAWRGGDGCEATNSAFPSKERDKRTCDDADEGKGRTDAGELLAAELKEDENDPNLIGID